jgi:hypothetical protein
MVEKVDQNSTQMWGQTNYVYVKHNDGLVPLVIALLSSIECSFYLKNVTFVAKKRLCFVEQFFVWNYAWLFILPSVPPPLKIIFKNLANGWLQREREKHFLELKRIFVDTKRAPMDSR